MSDQSFGRLPSVDARDARYSMALARSAQPLSFMASLLRALPWRYWKTGPIRDQGPFPQCVGFAWWQWLASAPLMSQYASIDAPSIYHHAQQLDEWPGEDYDGTSVRGGVKCLQERGVVASYVWAQTPADLRDWVMTRGTVVVGTPWYSGMLTPGADGHVHAAGEVVGGHAWTVIGFNRISRRYRAVNSWGNGWGQGGRFWISEEDLCRLIFDEAGEACAATEQRVVDAPIDPPHVKP